MGCGCETTEGIALVTKVLLLCNYCGDDDPSCSNDLPCLDCLKMCNIATMRGKPSNNLGGYDFNRDLLATGETDRAKAEAALMNRIMADMKEKRREVGS